MKVDFIDRIGDKSGIGTYSTKLFHAIKDQGVDIEAREPKLSLPILESTIQNFIEVPFIVLKSNADVIHLPSQERTAGLWFFPKKLLSNIVVTVHDISPYVNDYSGPVSQIISRFYCRSLKKIPRIIAISEFTKSELVEHLNIPEERIDVVYQGIDKEYFYPREKDVEKLEKYGIKQPYTLYVGSEINRKNMKGVLRKFSELKSDNHDLTLIKVGNAGRQKYREKTLEYMEELGLERGKDIIFTGFVDQEDLPQIYSSAEKTILWSHYEGLGRAIIESTMCGTPILTRDKPPMNELSLKCDSRLEGIYLKNLEISDWKESANKTVEIYEGDY